MYSPYPARALQRSESRQGICLIRSLLLWGLLALSGPIAAEEEDDAEEREQPVQDLFQSTLVYPQEQKELQVTFSPRFHKGQEEDQWILPLGVEYGITDAFQVGLEMEVYKHLDPDDESSEQGIGDAEVEAQYSWMSISGLPLHAALGVGVLIPTGDEDKDLGEGSVAVEPVAILAADLDALDGGQVFLNIGAEIDKDQTEKFVNVGVFLALDDLVPSLEWNWSEEEEERYLTPGLTWNSEGPWSLGLGVPIGLEDDADDYRVILQFIYETMVN